MRRGVACEVPRSGADLLTSRLIVFLASPTPLAPQTSLRCIDQARYASYNRSFRPYVSLCSDHRR
ncbi:hypothetical protein SBA5_100103 [Candidatus Sulfotelmatomonas gaucii]|uniref:Uncharacterized protein n=1 Tax=Candidatus Sulfuritelmatomonas gaucii TaxID=2043161 RepID=A0A2N9L3G2_9BACT|nr:hypothetical protein SBA5_100103 [Candidatus Sulfotelmatomonas gaucii]